LVFISISQQNNKKSHTMALAEIKKTEIRGYLAMKGILPVSGNEGRGMYRSPFRDDCNASFKVDYERNLWHDFRTGEGGSIIDLVMKMEHCSFFQAASMLESLNGQSLMSRQDYFNMSTRDSGPAFAIREVKPLSHPALLDYLSGRRISLAAARQYCREVHYSVGGKDYFAIGFPNDKGGFVLRSSCFKGCTLQAPTTLKNGSLACHVFEGFMDFLSYLTLQGIDRLPQDVAVLNSVVNLRKAMPFIRSHQVINLCLDNDEAGRQAARLIKEGIASELNAYPVPTGSLPNSEGVPIRLTEINDLSERYSGYKDLNDYLCRKPVAKPEARQALKPMPQPKRKGLRP
jgi:hypothetical protein